MKDYLRQSSSFLYNSPSYHINGMVTEPVIRDPMYTTCRLQWPALFITSRNGTVTHENTLLFTTVLIDGEVGFDIPGRMHQL
jgi:hypothetical protein